MAESRLNHGDDAPDFKLKNADEKEISLADFRGRWLVLYFYPKDNTSGCTLEAKDFTEQLKDFRDMDAAVTGVSPDSLKSHRNFIKKHDLKIELLSDPGHGVLEAYRAWGLKKMYGKEYYGVVRSTFIIDPEGKIAAVWPKVKVKGHVTAVKEKLAQLKGE